MTDSVKDPAEKQVEVRLLDYLLPSSHQHRDDAEVPAEASSPSSEDNQESSEARHHRTREKLRVQLQSGALEDRMIEIAVEERSTVVGVLGNAGMEMDVEFQNMFEKMLPTKRETRRISVRDARKLLFSQEAEKLIDKDKIHRTATERTEQQGIIFLDEIDKIAGNEKQHGPDVSRQGVQRDLLPIVEGSTVVTKYGPVKTDHILFVAAGAFHASKPSDLMPELQGRFPIRVELQDLAKEDFVRILREPKNSLTKQQIELLKTEGLSVTFTDDAIDTMAQIAFDVNRRTQNIGARRLYTIMERVFEAISFDASDLSEKSIKIDAAYVTDRLRDIVEDEDLSKFIL